MDIYGKCPACNYDLDAGDIVEVYKKQRDDGYTWCSGMTDEEIVEHVKEIKVEYGDTKCPKCGKVLNK